MGKKKHKKDPASWEIKRMRAGSEHIDNCEDGYMSTSSNLYRQVHHIIPISSVSNATISKQLKNNDKLRLVKKCLKITVWDINEQKNCISLPLKWAYADKRAPSGWDGLPCHLVDHPAYTAEVSKNLKVRVWLPSIRVAKNCEFNPKSLENLLKRRSDHWRSFLKDRGQGKRKEGGAGKGTQYCWENRGTLKKWYVPFSMHPGNPPKRNAAPDWDKLSGTIKEKLEKIFKSIK